MRACGRQFVGAFGNVNFGWTLDGRVDEGEARRTARRVGIFVLSGPAFPLHRGSLRAGLRVKLNFSSYAAGAKDRSIGLSSVLDDLAWKLRKPARDCAGVRIEGIESGLRIFVLLFD